MSKMNLFFMYMFCIDFYSFNTSLLASRLSQMVFEEVPQWVSSDLEGSL